MESDEPGLAALSRLAASASIADRAFAASALALRYRTGNHNDIATIYGLVRETATAAHADVRARIRTCKLDRQALLEELHRQPLELRDHLLEEILGIAYPPLEQVPLPPDGVPYSPSGLREILFALERSGVGPDTTLVDLGSGLGKVVLLAALLTGTRACGVEIDPHLVARAASAAASLGIANAQFLHGDIRHAAIPSADAYYLFIPLQHSEDVVERLAPVAAERSIRVLSQPLDEKRVPFLRASGASSYWLTMYESTQGSEK
jgi:SAM-dependent methyltransferase